MFRFIILISLLLPATGFSQLYINKTKSQVKQELNKRFLKKDSISASITETDSTLLLKIRGAGVTEADHIYGFDRSGKCSTEKIVTWCDSCHEKLLQQLLADKKYNWKKINMNQYVSDFSESLFIEVQVMDDVYSFTILKFSLNKKMYDFLLEKNN
ncbi:MAG TPA: hypothetical protein VK483_18285 [Chitinophagaceae bacterium]|nr:hypothetical protein [Chitinophagaceae bacterium]